MIKYSTTIRVVLLKVQKVFLELAYEAAEVRKR